MQDVITGGVHLRKIRIPNWTYVPLNEDTNLEQFEQCIVRLPIHPSVQQYEHEQNVWFEQEFHLAAECVPIYSGGQMKWKLQYRLEHLTANAMERNEPNRQ